MAKVRKLEERLQRHLPHVHYAIPTSSNYAEIREALLVDNTAVPLAIARLKTALICGFNWYRDNCP
jgi:hypothetical protein